MSKNVLDKIYKKRRYYVRFARNIYNTDRFGQLDIRFNAQMKRIATYFFILILAGCDYTYTRPAYDFDEEIRLERIEFEQRQLDRRMSEIEDRQFIESMGWD